MKRHQRHRSAKGAPAHGDSTVEVTIERILPGGAGIAHAEGRTILVSLAAPGDRLLVRLESQRGGVAFGSIVEVLEPSPVRVEAPCPYFGRCGGCDFQQLTYRAQLTAKVEIIRDCLRRIGRLEVAFDIPITPSPSEWRYRSRAEWQHDGVRNRLGYFERGSHDVCDVETCLIIVAELEETLQGLRTGLRDGTVSDMAREFQAVAGEEGISLLPSFEESGTGEVSRTIGGHRYVFSADAFFQINHELLPALIETALRGAGGATAIDLYCGAGLFTLPLAERFAQVTGVESHRIATGFARRNLESANLTNAVIECSTVGEWLRRYASAKPAVDFLLLDPPRTGAEEDVIVSILNIRPRHIAYVSCDPATLSRDLRGLTNGGYHLEAVAGFDMFPQTHHVEALAHLFFSG